MIIVLSKVFVGGRGLGYVFVSIFQFVLHGPMVHQGSSSFIYFKMFCSHLTVKCFLRISSSIYRAGFMLNCFLFIMEHLL